MARIKLINKKQRQLADRRNRTGVALTHEMAVTKIQSALRGMLWRRRIRAQADAVRYPGCTSAIVCHRLHPRFISTAHLWVAPRRCRGIHKMTVAAGLAKCRFNG